MKTRYSFKRPRYRWKSERISRIRQFLFRGLPLLIVIIIASAGLLVLRNASLRARFDDSSFRNLSARTFRAVDGYFTPLIDFLASASLWGEVAGNDSIGEPADYVDLLQVRLERLGSVSTFGMADPEARELVIRIPRDGAESEWYETVRGTENSLSRHRRDNGIEYLSLPDIAESRTGSFSESSSPFSVSAAYELPLSEEPGLTMRLDTALDETGRRMIHWLDLPLTAMVDRFEVEKADEEAVIFLIFSDGTFLFLPVGEVTAIINDVGGTGAADRITAISREREPILRAALSSGEDRERETNRFRFTYADAGWWADYRVLAVGAYEIYLGTLIPETSLFSSFVVVPIQIAMASLIVLFAVLLFVLSRDYRRALRVFPTEEDRLMKKIRGGETPHLEMKSSLRWDYREDRLNKSLEEVIVKSVAAFNNARGGTLIIGVDDDGGILGLEKDFGTLKGPDSDYFELHLRNLLSSRYGIGYVSKNVSIRFPILENKEICCVDVRPGKEPLYTLASTKGEGSKEHFFVRSGNSSRALESSKEITRYVLGRFRRWAARQ